MNAKELKEKALEISRRHPFSSCTKGPIPGFDPVFMAALERNDHLDANIVPLDIPVTKIFPPEGTKTNVPLPVRGAVNEAIYENWMRIRNLSNVEAIKFLAPVVRQKTNCNQLHAVEGLAIRFHELDEIGKSAREIGKQIVEMLRSTTAEEVRR